MIWLIMIGIAVVAAIVATFIWPQVGLGVQIVGLMFGVLGVSMLAVGSGALYGIFGLMFIGLAIFTFRRRPGLLRFSLQEIAAMVLLLYMLATIVFTPCPNSGTNKILRYIGIALATVITSRVFASTREDLRQTLRVLGWLSMFVLAFYILLYVFAGSVFQVGDRFTGGANALTMGYTAAPAIVFVAYLCISRSMMWVKVMAVVLILGGLCVIGASGSRGPLMAVMLGASLTFMARRMFIRSLLILVLLFGLSYVAVEYIIPVEARDRIMTVFESGALERSHRTELYRRGIDQFKDNVMMGGGIGSFSNYVGWGDQRGYCHNLIFEVAGELGVIGLCILGSMFCVCVRPMLRLRSRREPMIMEGRAVQWLFWVGLVNAMLSYDMPEQRALFAAMGFLGAIRRWPSPEEEYSLSYSQEPFIGECNEESRFPEPLRSVV